MKDAFSLAVSVFRDFWECKQTYFDETVVNFNSFTLVMSKVMKSHLCQLSAQVLCKLSKGEQDEPGWVCDLVILYIYLTSMSSKTIKNGNTYELCS